MTEVSRQGVGQAECLPPMSCIALEKWLLVSTLTLESRPARNVWDFITRVPN